MDTLDPKKKKVYIGIIAVCLLASAGILIYGFGGSGTPAPTASDPAPTPAQSVGNGSQSGSRASAGAVQVPQLSGMVDYAPPTVFPDEPRFDLGIYQSGALGALTDYQPLTVNESEVGRENPFLKY